jgi:ubiquinone/menaquinone biosynthesis C-methylase UbiE
MISMSNIENDKEPSTNKLSGLTATEYDERYYQEHANSGLDYLGHGYWQESYAQMVSDATLQNTYKNPYIVDAGCACGSILNGFRKTGLYKGVLGIDLSAHMIRLGRKHFGYTDTELLIGSITDIPVPRATVSLLHSAQVLEHIHENLTNDILDEFARVLCQGGRAFICLDAIRHGENVEMYMGDPTHVNIQPVSYWTKKFQERGLFFDVEAYNGFVRSSLGPTLGDARSFFHHYPYWSVWTLIKL